MSATVGEDVGTVLGPLRTTVQLRLIPHRMQAAHGRDRLEVVLRRRGRGAPLQRFAGPRIISGRPAGPRAAGPVDQSDEHAEGEDERADRRKQIPDVPAETALVGVRATGLAQEAGDVHREEGEVETYEHEPEADLAEPLVEEPAR